MTGSVGNGSNPAWGYINTAALAAGQQGATQGGIGYWAHISTDGPCAGTYDATNTIGTGIGGFNDWYISSGLELQNLYWYFKHPVHRRRPAGGLQDHQQVRSCCSPRARLMTDTNTPAQTHWATHLFSTVLTHSPSR